MNVDPNCEENISQDSDDSDDEECKKATNNFRRRTYWSILCSVLAETLRLLLGKTA